MACSPRRVTDSAHVEKKNAMALDAVLSGELLQRKSYFQPVALTLFAALLFLPGLGARDFWAPGEPIYGEIIRAMYERNDWIVPILNGQLYADKPVLYFWLALVASKVAGGVSEWTVRLPAALGGLGLVLVTYQFGKTFYDGQTGFFSALVIATSSRVLWESRFLRLDTLLSFFLFLGLYFFLKTFIKRVSTNYYLLAYFCFALATLTKGPIGLALPGLALLSLILLTGRWRELARMRLPSGCIVAALVLAPWLWLLHWRGEDPWVRDFILIHNIQNYALEPIGHIRPWYYYFINLPPDFLPWTLFVPGALLFYYPWKEKLHNAATLALLCWFAAVFIFFSVSKSKIAYYLLPLLPSLALLVGCYLRGLIVEKENEGMHWRWTAGFLYLLIALFGLAGVSLPFVVFRLERGMFLWALCLATIFLAGAISLFVLLRRKQLGIFIYTYLAVLLGVSIVASVGVLPYLDKYKSPRPIGEFVRFRLSKDSPVYVFDSNMADFNYYAGREQIPVVASAEAVDQLTASSQEAYLIIDAQDLKQTAFSASYKVISEHKVGNKKWYILIF
jgi:4-amino-4-deoxy-L-arabinose transferase-like glycosyltransferase